MLFGLMPMNDNIYKGNKNSDYHPLPRVLPSTLNTMINNTVCGGYNYCNHRKYNKVFLISTKIIQKLQTTA